MREIAGDEPMTVAQLEGLVWVAMNPGAPQGSMVEPLSLARIGGAI